MNYEIVCLDEKIVKGIMKETTNNNGQCVKDIGEVWNKFINKEAYTNISNKINNKAIGLYTDYKGDFTEPYNFLACCEVSSENNSETEKNITTKIIPMGRYAKFTIKGDVKEVVGKFWCELWKMDLDRAYTCDFEEYQNETEDMTNAEIHVYIALN